MEQDAKVKSLAKALKLLSYFNTRTPELGISDLAELSGNLKSTTHNIMSTYQQFGFVEKNPVSGKYRLGHKILELSNVFYIANDFRQIARPFIERIANRCNETVYLAVPQMPNIMYIDAAYPQGSIHMLSVIGVTAPMYCTAVGKAIMAHLSEQDRAKVGEYGLRPFTSKTICDMETLEKDIQQVQERGYAIDDMEHEYGIRCMGMAITNIRSELVGALSISGPSLRLTNEKFEECAPFLRQTAEELKSFLK